MLRTLFEKSFKPGASRILLSGRAVAGAVRYLLQADRSPHISPYRCQIC